jgi:hypothetical protein
MQVPEHIGQSEEKRQGVKEVCLMFALPMEEDRVTACPDLHAGLFAFLPVASYGFRCGEQRHLLNAAGDSVPTRMAQQNSCAQAWPFDVITLQVLKVWAAWWSHACWHVLQLPLRPCASWTCLTEPWPVAPLAGAGTLVGNLHACTRTFRPGSLPFMAILCSCQVYIHHTMAALKLV